MVWPASHNAYKYLTTRDRHFEMVDQKIYLLWGTRGVDRSACSQWDEADLGRVLFDMRFDVADPDTQRALIDACQSLPDDPLLSIKPQSTECIMLAFQEWLAQPARAPPHLWTPSENNPKSSSRILNPASPCLSRVPSH